jgi:hypothetical protein
MRLRNSCSKTDPEAAFMRMKEKHMKNGQLKGYDVRLSTRNQCIVHFGLRQNPTDTTTLIPQFESIRSCYGYLPETMTADAGHGSDEKCVSGWNASRFKGM